MKFMKLGSKPDSFRTDGNVRYVETELSTDLVVNIGDVKFYLHKFPLSAKSTQLQKLVANTSSKDDDELHIHDIPGGPPAFEVCAKFCYGMVVTLNAYNVIAARCAAEYLGMHETCEKGNLVYKIDIFLSSIILRSWKDSIIVLHTTRSLNPLCEELKLTSHCIEAVASTASVDVSDVDWSYTYNRKRLPEENGNNPNWNGIRNRAVPKDWWIEDLCELEIDLYRQVILNIRNKGLVSNKVIREALSAYVLRKLPGFGKGKFQNGNVIKTRSLLETIVQLLPAEKGSSSCSFLLKLIKTATVVGSGEAVKEELIRRVGQQLEEASVPDLLIQACNAETTTYDVHTFRKILVEFMAQGRNAETKLEEGYGIQEVRGQGILSEGSKLRVVKVVDGYLTEIGKDPKLPLSTFMELAEMVAGFPRPAHDGLYRAIDTYLKEHPVISKSERKRICRLMNCKKLSVDACTHAVQNERLPLRMIVQVLFFERVRASASSGSSTPDLPKAIKELNSGSHGISRSTAANTEEDWDAVATAEELRALKGELAARKLGNGGGDGRGNEEKAAITKMK